MRRAAPLLLLLAGLPACGKTEMLITIGSDLTIPDELATLELLVTDRDDNNKVYYGLGGDQTASPKVLCGGGGQKGCYTLPMSVTLYPGPRGERDRVEVQVKAYDRSLVKIIDDRATFTFTPGLSQRLDFFLYRSCVGTACAANDDANSYCGPVGCGAPPSPREIDAPFAADGPVALDAATDGPVSGDGGADLGDTDLGDTDLGDTDLGPDLTSALTIKPASTRVKPGGSTTFVASQPVQWSVLSGGVGGSIDNNGVYAAPMVEGTDRVQARDGMGNIQIATVIVATWYVDVFAGARGGSGHADDIGTDARLNSPTAAISDGAGNLYVSDGNHTIRKIVLATGAVSTVAGTAGVSQSDDGTGAAAHFAYPEGIAADGAGNLYVAETTRIRKIVASTGVVTTLAGSAAQGSFDATGTAATFYGVHGMAYDGAGNLYVTETANQTIRKIVIATGVVTTLAGTALMSGTTDETGAAARFNRPTALAYHGGNLYVTDASSCTIRKIVIATRAVTTWAGMPASCASTDGTGTAARFSFAEGIAVGGNQLFVAESGRIRAVDLTTAAVTTLAGGNSSTTTDGVGSAAGFNSASGLAFESMTNTVYVTQRNSFASAVRKVLLNGTVTTLAGMPYQGGTADGIGGAARMRYPNGMASDGANVYIVDSNNATLRKVELATGQVSTWAGKAGANGPTDGTGTAARFSSPSSLAIDGPNLFVTDGSTVRKVVLATAEVTTLAATGGTNYGIAADGLGNLYIADSTNLKIKKVVIASGVVTTFAGSTSGENDGTGVAAQFRSPFGLTREGANLFVTDGNRIRQIAIATAAVTTVAGAYEVAELTDGIGTAARFFNLWSIAGDGAGTLYIADESTVRKMPIATFQVTTFAGKAGRMGTKLGVLPAGFNRPVGILALTASDLLVTDGLENVVLRLH